ncbi:sulfatase-like hydrolase/transferase [Deferribacterales bacterium RsTz2092]|nr:membrane protein [Deferribacterales bacterium]
MKKYPYLSFILLITLVYSCICNSIYYGALLDGHKFVIAFVLSFFASLPYWYFIGLFRALFYLLLPLTFIFSAVATYFVKVHNAEISKMSVIAIVETNPHEAIDVIDKTLVSYVIIAIILSAVCLYARTKLKRPPLQHNIVVLTLALLFALAYNFFKPEYLHHSNYSMPYVMWNATHKGIKRHIELKNIKRIALTDVATFERKDDSPLTVVFVIGESLRSDHLHINGYERNTTPYLDKSEAVAYKDAIACAASTSLSVPCMLTRANNIHDDSWSNETSFVSIFKSLGFETWWLSNQYNFRASESTTALIAAEADHIFRHKNSIIWGAKTLDTDLAPYIKDALATPASKKLIMVHTYGSHWHFDSKYMAEDAYFKPYCENKELSECSQEALVNSYDNSVRATDKFFGELFLMLANERAIVIYASDHGSELDNKEILNRSSKDVLNVPIIVWFSPALRQDARYKNVVKNSSKKIDHSYLFHSTTDCAGIESNIIDKGRSVCR